MIFIKKELKEMQLNNTENEQYLTWKEYIIIWSLVIVFFSGEPYLAKIIFEYLVAL